MTGIRNFRTLEAARNKLIQAGLVRYRSQGQGKAGIYSLPVLYETSYENAQVGAGKKATSYENAQVMSDVSAQLSAQLMSDVSAHINKQDETKREGKAAAAARAPAHEGPAFDAEKPPGDPPTLKDVEEYAEAMGLEHVNAAKFWKYYEAGNWRDDGGNPFDWRRKLVKWDYADAERKTNADNGKGGGRGVPPAGFCDPPSGEYAALYRNAAEAGAQP